MATKRGEILEEKLLECTKQAMMMFTIFMIVFVISVGAMTPLSPEQCSRVNPYKAASKLSIIFTIFPLMFLLLVLELRSPDAQLKPMRATVLHSLLLLTLGVIGQWCIAK